MNFKKQISLFPILLTSTFLFSFFACENDGNEKAIEEIQSDGKISSIIRSPITANGLKDTVNVAKMIFEETEFDFGEVVEGEVVEHTFKFKNTGKIPLFIDHASSTCGCTVPEWPKEAISAGGTGEILVRFNTDNKPNNQEKSVSITANTYPSLTKVMLKGFVNPKN